MRMEDKKNINILVLMKLFGLRLDIDSYIFLFKNMMILINFIIIISLTFITKNKLIPIFYLISVILFELLTRYIDKKIIESFENTENEIDYVITGRIKYSIFQKMIEDLDTETKYHVCRGLDEEGYVKDWAIFRKDMSHKEYFANTNEAILSSSKNDITDLLLFVEKEKKDV